MYCYIISLKYSPVFSTLGSAFGSALSHAHCSVQYMYSKAYRELLDSSSTDVQYLSESRSFVGVIIDSLLRIPFSSLRMYRQFRCSPPAVLLFLNPHPGNIIVTLIARLSNPSVRAVLVLHEPHKREKLVYGLRQAIYITLVELIQRLTLSVMNAVTVPSTTAAQAFTDHIGSRRWQLRVIPLPFIDQACQDDLPRVYATFVGHAVKVKGIDRFFQLVEEAEQRGEPIQFQIVTGSDITRFLARLSPGARKRLTIVTGAPLSDQQISRAVRRSFCVVALYETVMQSGVVPVAFMNGTPVLATDLPGLTEFVSDGHTGVVVPVAANSDLLFSALHKLRAEEGRFGAECRAVYERVFDVQALAPHVPWLLGNGRVEHVGRPG